MGPRDRGDQGTERPEGSQRACQSVNLAMHPASSLRHESCVSLIRKSLYAWRCAMHRAGIRANSCVSLKISRALKRSFVCQHYSDMRSEDAEAMFQPKD